MKDLENRIKILEDKTCSPGFIERIEYIFLHESYNELTSKDIQKLKEYFPDKLDFLTEEIYKQTSANI